MIFSCLALIMAYLMEVASASSLLRDLESIGSTAASSCPKIKCDSKAKECAFIVGDATSKNVTLNTCSVKNQSCPFTAADLTKNDVNVTCIEVTPPTPTPKTRYPGEPCDDKFTCFSGNCTSSVCTGNATGTGCKEHADCVVGNYCNATTEVPAGICTKQVALKGKCANSFQCVNSAFCNVTSCESYFSFAAGSDITGLPEASSACIYNSIVFSEGKTLCNARTYASTTPKPDGTSHLVACESGNTTTCSYNNTDKTITTRTCECGYGPNQKAWCPAAHSETSVKFENYYKSVRDTFDNKCHTLKRTKCDLTDSDTTKRVKAVAENKLDTEDLHLFYGAEPCVKALLGGLSSNFIYVSLLISFLSTMFLF